MSDNYKRKHQWTRSPRKEERKSMQEVPYCSTACKEVKGREIIIERDQQRNIRIL
jgi:hypothetical protein